MEKLAGIVNSITAPSTNMLWLCKNELKAFINGKWEVLNKHPETNKEELKKDNSIVELSVGNTKKIRNNNLSNLRQGQFFVLVDDKHGIGNWNSNGGNIHTIENGYNVSYSITTEGAVIKETESPDIYLEYVKMGGKLGPSDFVSDLVALLG